MSKISKLIAIAYENAYDLNLKKQYSQPMLCDFGGDLDKRWYVYFSFRNPISAKLVRQPGIYTGLHHHKNLRDRRAAAKILIEAISGILKNGYNPFVDEDQISIEEARKLNIPQAVEFVLTIKKSEYSTGYTDFKSRLTLFRDWLLKNGLENRYITAVNKTMVINYLNYVAQKNSPANRNNSRAALSKFFRCLVDNEIIIYNFIEKIPKLNVVPERNRSYTPKQEADIFEHLEKVDPHLALYIKFISYSFLRPIEVNRLSVGDIDVVDRKMYVRAKNQKVKIKIIPEILLREIPLLDGKNKDDAFFGMSEIGQPWTTAVEDRRGYYSKRFRKVIKTHFGLSANYGLYSFRHTFAVKLYNSLLEGSTPFEAKSRLMLIGGWKSMDALEKYLRNIDAVLPDDYSHLIG